MLKSRPVRDFSLFTKTYNPSVSEWVTVSIGGVTVVPSPENTYPVYLKIADTMLYDAKNHGRNQVVWADERLKQMWEK